MRSMVMSFVKRAVIVPLLMAAISVAGLFIFLSVTSDLQEGEINNSSPVFQTVQFSKLSELSEGDYVGKLNFGEKSYDITYIESGSDSIVADEVSSEPWNKGAVIIEGTSAMSQLGAFRSAKAGDTVTLEFYLKGKYQYKITGVKSGLTLSDIHKSKKDNTLLICRSYNDFSSGGNSKLYAVYSAKLTGEVKYEE